MTLDEAIAHAREVEKFKRAESTYNFPSLEKYYDDCKKCAEEHKQLAEWLEELKHLREFKEKYRWHDLRKNPEDLPNKCEMYIVYIEHPTKEKEVGVGYYKNMHGYGGWIALIPNDGNVIAWKEIEPFEEN